MTARGAERLVVVLDAADLGERQVIGHLTRWPGPEGRRGVSFAYDEAWLADSAGFAIDPRTGLFRGEQQLGADTLPPALLDTTPDAWGRMLLSRERRRLLDTWELLVSISDQTRMGALRLGLAADGPYVRTGESGVPPMASLRELQQIARLVEDDPDAAIPEARLRDLVAPGSSLGGARPKANIRDEQGVLWIAKFPSREDRRLDIGAWEHVHTQLASMAGIDVPQHRLEQIGPGRGRTYLARRFDRDEAGGRRLYVSAMTLTDHRDGEPAAYPDIARAIVRYGATDAVRHDLAQLFRRLLFNVLAGVRDDHLRNHGFLRTPEGWRLAPAFDLNPARAMRQHSLSLDGRTEGQDLPTAMATHRLYRLDEGSARRALAEVAAAVRSWEEVAAATGIDRGERQIVAGSFTPLEDVDALL